MDFNTLVKKRYSCRRYQDKQVPDELVLEILNTAHLAPSAANRQSWRFLVIREKQNLEKIFASYNREWIRTAQCVIVVIGNPAEAWIRNYDNRNSINENLAIVMDHLLLSAAEKGLGTCWIGNFDPDILRQELALSDSEVVQALTPLGYPADKCPDEKTRKKTESLISWI